MKKARISKKIIAAFMAFIIAFASAPIQAIALGIENMEQIEENVVDTGYEIDEDVFLVEEDISKRGQFEKHYLCSDGTYVSVTYPEAIHYLDANNKWQDVDQSLTYDSASGMYISDKADFDVSFSNKASADNIARIERNGYTLSWGIQTTKKNGNALSRSAIQPNSSININTDVVLVPSSSVSAIIENPIDNKKTDIKDRLVANSDTFALPKISSQISYSNIFDETQNVSLKYTVYHNKIEEDIIISERGDLQSVSMNMDVGTLTPIVNADGSVDLVDANYEMQFHIGIPYMVDADHNVCNDIQVTSVKDGTSCVITYTPNAEWFESSERVFPILLDPSITTNDYVSNIEDTYVEENSTAIHSSEQYLYVTRNGNNRRNAIVRVTKLPEIDESMPIVYATLSLTAQTAATDYVDLKAAYLDTGLELNEYDYSLTAGDYFSYTSYSAMDYGETSVTFDVTAHIYEMYSDKKFDDENGYDYHGDFVIGYDYATDTTYVPPFYSSEYTTPSVRPVFTVKYGYTLPAGMLNGSVYSFMNAGSFSHMSVNGTSPANNSNIYQVWNESGVSTTSQKFKLEYVSGTGGYFLRSMSSSSGTDKVVSINRAGGELSTNMNVRLSSATDSMAQEWLIVPVDYDIFRIVPRANMSLTLTAYGYNDGTNTGTSATSQGNIFVKTRVEDNNFQEWYIYDNSNNEVNTSQYRATIETGNYFLGNSYSGHYLHRGTGTTVNGMSGRLSALGENTVKWKIVNMGDGYCTIQRSDAPRYYLAPASTTSGSNARIYGNASETIPENVKWSIRSATGGGCIIQHKASGLYLTDVGGTANPTTVRIEALATPGTDAYKKQVWRVASEDYYVELGLAASFDDIVIDVGETKTALINKSPSSASWASYTDFDYSITSGGSYVTYDSTTHKFTGLAAGVATINATHKTTGTTKTFYVFVFDGIYSIECLINSTYDIRALQLNNHAGLSNVTWHTMDSSIATVNSSGVVTGVNSGYTFMYATINNGSDIALMYEVKIMDIHTQMLQEFTNNEIQYLYCPTSALNWWTRALPNAFEVKVEIINLLRDYYRLPVNDHPTPSEIKIIVNNLEDELGLVNSSEDYATAIFHECFLGYQGLYNQEYLTQQRIQYFNYLKEIVAFCAFSMAAQLDTVNTGSAYNGYDDLTYDLSKKWGHNESSSNVMLGSNGYGGKYYFKEAQDRGYRYFYSTDYDKYYNKYGADFVRSVNTRYLQRCIANNCTFYFCSNPTTAPITSSLHMEYSYLLNYYNNLWGTAYLRYNNSLGLWYFSPN